MTDEVVAAFKGELQFAGWTDSSRGGPRVTFRLADRDLLERFIGCEGKRYACMLVDLGDDETPADQAPSPAAAPKTAVPAKRERMGPLCEWAVMRCGEDMFQQWAWSQMKAFDLPTGMPISQVARLFICEVCGISSRKDLDTNESAARLLHVRVRRPYMVWLESLEAKKVTA